MFMMDIVLVLTKDLGNTQPFIVSALNYGHSRILTFVVEWESMFPTVNTQFT